MRKIAIIGAGLSGLSAAHQFQDIAQITVFDKSRGVGGRMSQRRAEPYFFDHGAQYFTARTPEFQAFIAPMIEQGVIKRWDAVHAEIDGKNTVEIQDWTNDEPRYVGAPAMNSIGKHLAKGIDVHIGCRISAMQRDQGWQLHDEAGQQHGPFDTVILAIPPQQALDLLPQSFAHIETISNIQMEPCFALMLGFEESFVMDFDAAHVHNSSISWLANNASKPNRSDHMSLVVHSSHAFAQANLETDQKQIIDQLCDAVSEIIQQDVSQAQHKQLHRWLYANNTTRNVYKSFYDSALKIGVCGDWTQGGRVEGAFVSARALSTEIGA